ncbi:hypothetical protein ACFLWO_02175 [Chloroflexota bacterium]
MSTMPKGTGDDEEAEDKLTKQKTADVTSKGSKEQRLVHKVVHPGVVN